MKAIKYVASVAFALVALQLSSVAAAAEEGSYALNAGDTLIISVWKEADLLREVLVRPDGKISFPLVGDVAAAGNSPEQVQATIVEKLQLFIPDAVVTVAVRAVGGNKVYVLGKVARPGEYVVTRQLDVMQALAVAGGLNAFASEGKIKILRRRPDGTQQALSFDYGRVREGRDLESNIGLISGDVVVVP